MRRSQAGVTTLGQDHCGGRQRLVRSCWLLDLILPSWRIKMDQTIFWSLIEQTKCVNTINPDQQSELLIQELVKLPEDDIIAFDLIFSEFNHMAYNWNLWAAAYIINCGCSDDSFTDFRAWLIGQGKLTFDRALQDPQILFDVVDHPYLTQPTHLFAVFILAYEIKNGQVIPDVLRCISG
jgi:hypothetical protein